MAKLRGDLAKSNSPNTQEAPLTFLDQIRAYLARGWQLVPYPTREKRPRVTEWQKTVFTESDFPDGCNVGIKLCGELVDVDLDTPEAIALATEFLPETGMKHGRKSAPRAHWWYLARGRRKYAKFQAGKGKTLLELRTSEDGSLQTMCPPSVHPEGEQLQWTGETPGAVEHADLRRACGRLAAAVLLVRAFPANGRNDLALALSGALLRNGWKIEEAEHFVLTVFQHGGSLAPELRAKAVAATQAKLEVDEPVTGIPRLVDLLGKEIVDKLVEWLRLSRDDASDAVTDEVELANHVVRNNADIFHRASNDKWYTWDGQRWTCRDQKEILRRVQRSIAMIKENAQRVLQSLPPEVREAKKEELEDLDPAQLRAATSAKQTFAFAKGASKFKTIASVARGCEALLHRDESELDADPMLFNCQNGTLDLNAGELRPHSKDDLITKVSPIAFDDSAPCPLWHAHLAKFLPDEDVRSFVRRLFGYAMTGSVKEQVFPIFWGNGKNGKSTLLETIVHIFGDYAMVASSRTFIESRSETRSELTVLEGARFVSCPEPKGTLDESIVKQVTGERAFSARGLYENTRTIRPTWKAVMACNEEPVINGGDDGIWRRLRLVPFNVGLTKEEIIGDYDLILRKEAAGVLRWCLIGCLEWQEMGLAAPAQVLAATEDYRHDSDPLDEFVTECLEEHKGFEDVWVRSSDVYRVYRAWAQGRGAERAALSHASFGAKIRQRGFGKASKREGKTIVRAFTGVRLNGRAKQMLAFSSTSFSEPLGGEEK